MKLRTQLVIVFLLLAILPLTGIVLYSYLTSQSAFRAAVEKETLALAEQMDTRMAGITDELGRRIERIGGLPIDTLVAASDRGTGSNERASAVLAAELGESAEFLDRIEWQVDESFDAFDAFDPTTHDSVTPVEPVAATAPVVPEAPAPPAPPTPPNMQTIVIHIPEMKIRENGREMLVGPREQTITIPTGIGLEATEAGMTLAMEQAAKATEIAQREMARHRAEIASQRSERERLEREFSTIVEREGSRLGVLTARVREELIVKKVLSSTAPESNDVAFAIDREGTILTASEAEKERLSGIDFDAIRGREIGDRGEDLLVANENWVVATTVDSETGLTFGIARPVRDSLRRMRATAMNNFGWGLGLVALALFGVIPIANHLTRDIEEVMDGVDRLSHGELDSPVRVRSTNEIGRLAGAFNQMAVDLKDHQQRLLDEERSRQEREVEQRILEAEYARKSRELEEARSFQLSLLPDAPPTHPDLDIAVLVRTATEVGGDYYDYHLNSDDSLTLALGDATGHGARAGTMVTIVKSLFAGKVESTGLNEFLDEGNRTIRQMGLERMAMALSVARFSPGHIDIASAGMPPALVYRADSGAIDELQCEAPPLGSLAYEYASISADLSPDDVVLLMTDGFPELEGTNGEPLGYEATQNLFRDVATENPSAILEAFAAEADRWTGGQPPSDDITFIAIRLAALA